MNRQQTRLVFLMTGIALIIIITVFIYTLQNVDPVSNIPIEIEKRIEQLP